MPVKVSTDAFASEAMRQLKEEVQYISSSVVDKAIEKTAAETAKEISAEAPRRTGAYAASWNYGYKRKKGNKTVMYVYAMKPEYRLTHLLENGHALRNGGRWEPKSKHIEPADKKIADRLVEAIKEELA